MEKTHDSESYKELADFETEETRAYGYALDLSIAIFDAMRNQGLSQRQLAEKMKVSPARLSQLLNLQPNLTLKTISKFELALGIQLLSIQQGLSNNEEAAHMNRSNIKMLPDVDARENAKRIRMSG